MSDILMDFKDGLLTDVGVSKSTFDNDYFVRAFAIRAASLVANFGRSSTFGISNVKTEMTNVSRAWSQYIMVKSFASALNTFPSRSSSNVALTRLFRSFAASLMLDERYVAEFYLCDWFGVSPRGLDGHRDLEEFLRESFDDDRSGSSDSEIYSDGGMWCWEGERVGGEYGLRDDIEGLISSLRAF
ncbi:hypothetical protein SISNIDRAFT_482541 [Sistotremastrum niveocremeum HHB9708]|uniref:Uncharacterized protein n=1 Tax=Sistotremastrum niveocremeum HHB9708 TaxID=1314777 RepID=A0A164YAX2_9AGAM|nr:hypothetical protein SISNIDRAFT_482541 [Sistotremastrum niveocremeum HHB9708]